VKNPFRSLRYRLHGLIRRWRSPLTVGVRLLLVRGESVLLVRHTYVDGLYLCGGAVERGETLEQAARREAREELGATLGPLRLFGAYSSFYERRSDHIVVFVCNKFTLSGNEDGEIAAYRFYDMRALPADTSPGTMRRVAEYQSGAAPAAARW